MNPDARTLLVIGAIGCWILAAAIEIQALHSDRDRPVPDRWTLGLLAQGLGLGLVAQRGMIADLWSISLASVLLLLTPLFIYAALQRIRGVDTNRFLIGIVPVGVGILLPIIGFSDEAFVPRAILVLCASLFGLSLSLWSAAQIVRTGYLVGPSLILVSGAMLAATFVAFVLAAIHRNVQGALSGEGVQRAFYAMNNLAILLSTLGYMNIRAIARRQLSRIDGLMRADGLTGFYGLAALAKGGTEELHRARRRGYPVCLMAIRIDGFENLRASDGNESALNALSRVATLLLKNFRVYDLAGRVSDSVLGVVMPELAPAGGLEAAERIRAGVAEDCATDGSLARITISIGLCDVRESHRDFDAAMREAVTCLERAQREGGNRVAASPPAPAGVPDRG